MSRKSSQKKKYLKICTNCGSTDIILDSSNAASWNYGMPSRYSCQQCGLLRYTFPEIDYAEIPHFSAEKFDRENRRKIKPFGKTAIKDIPYHSEVRLVGIISGITSVLISTVIFLSDGGLLLPLFFMISGILFFLGARK
ncbi:hypothetical protein HYU14_02015 [Candidatus Woesearchaeota archaeon]|nr:hypothetical protein [Candidatus Woesearchaeota archaeon]